MNNKTKLKVSIVFNIFIVLFTTIGTIIMYTGFKFMHGFEPVLEHAKFRMVKFFMVDSNMFMGIASLLFLIEELKLFKDKIKEISKKLYIFKLMSTTAVTITFLTVFLYLGPLSKGGITSMLQNSNLFFHLIIPVLSIITFTMFEKTDKLTVKDTLFGIVPTLLYGIYYLTNVLVHMENGKVSPVYDWYWFVQNGVWTAFIVVPFMLLISYLTSLSLWQLNKAKR